MRNTIKLCSKLALSLTLFSCIATSGPSARSGFAVAQNGAPPSDSDQSITVGGIQRSYTLDIPPGYDDSKPVPLVFILHGRGGSGKGIELTTNMSAKADKETFIAVYPNAAGNPAIWNSGIGAATNGADDVGFIRALLDKLEHDFRIDAHRIYCCGFSAGAIMSYSLGAGLSDRLAAIGVASGSIGAKQPNGSVRTISLPSHALPVIVFHGKQDQTIYYNGGGIYLNLLSVADSIAFWVKADGCAAPPQQKTEQNGNLVIDNTTDARTEAKSSCTLL